MCFVRMNGIWQMKRRRTLCGIWRNGHCSSMKWPTTTWAMSRHGIRIVRELQSASGGFPFGFCVKLQYRDIDTCIHPDYKGRYDLKYVKRFSETRLSWDQYRQIKDAIVEAGFLSMCTPWDELSVEKIAEHGFDFMKVPSCYMTDWPLLEQVAKYDLPDRRLDCRRTARRN